MASKPFSSRCSTLYDAYRKDGTRPLSAIKLIVMHDTEGGTARSIARYFQSSTAGGSTHLVVDDNECFRTLRNQDVPWGAPGSNYNGFHIEQCGYAKWSLAIWTRHTKTLRRAAYKAAFHCVKFGIPPVWVGAAGIKAGKRGVTTHAEVTKAYPAGNHTDPGPFWPRRRFMRYVREYYTQLTGIEF